MRHRKIKLTALTKYQNTLLACTYTHCIPNEHCLLGKQVKRSSSGRHKGGCAEGVGVLAAIHQVTHDMQTTINQSAAQDGHPGLAVAGLTASFDTTAAAADVSSKGAC
jgi:hypothetical protein